MGDETMLIATRFSTAVGDLAALAGDDHAKLAARHGARLGAVVRDALDAVAAVYEPGTEAVRDFPERRRRVLGQLAAMRAVLDRSGVNGELRRMARALVEVLEPGAPR